VPAVQVDGNTIVVTGRWIRIAAIQDEEWLEGDTISDPEACIAKLKEAGIRADLFTFAQKLPDTTPKHDYHIEWDNCATVPVTSYADWWEKRLPQETRRNVRLAGKRGVVVKVVQFDDELVRGIVDIYNETPVRQGRRFWHYGKGFDAAKRENASFPDRSEFIAAYLGNQLIGFVKLVYLGQIASIMQFLCKNEHSDKRPANALIAKTMEVCVAKGMRLLVYRKYTYGNDPDSQLTEFKRRNGFEPTRFPRYYVPLTAKGRVLIRLKLHGGLKGVLPENLKSVLVHLRSKWYQKAHSTNPAR